MIERFEYDDASHTYKMLGVEVPSVTKVLPYKYLYGNLERAREIGSLVHRTIYLHNVGDLDEESLDPLLMPYLEEYKRFRAENPHIRGIIDIKTGQPDPCTELQLAGYHMLCEEGFTLDGKPLKEVDVGYEITAFHPLYGYGGTIDILERSGDVLHLGTLYLRAELPYKFEDHSRTVQSAIRKMRTRNYFLAFLATYKWRKEHNR